MTEPVKPRRPYRSERRREQAQETRRRIFEAARRLFVEQGYAGATINGIAAEAGVAAETVYAIFRNKRTLLRELVRFAVRGDETRAVLDQDDARAVAAATDRGEQLRIFAADIAERLERAAPLMQVLGAAAPLEPDLAALRTQLHAARLENLRTLVDALAANGRLRLDREAAAETVWALASPELYSLVVESRGWTRTRYAAWLEHALRDLLIP